MKHLNLLKGGLSRYLRQKSALLPRTWLLLLALCSTLSSLAQVTVTIGTGTSVSAISPFTSSGTNTHGVLNIIYLQPSIDVAGNIEKLAFYKSAGTGTSPFVNVSIYMKHTNAATLAAGNYAGTSGYQLVYTGSFPNDAPPGWQEVTFNTPFTYNNIDNLEILILKNNSPTTTTAASPSWHYTSGTTRLRRYNGSGPITTSTALTTSTFIPNVRLVINEPPCTNPPVPGITASTQANVCSGQSFTLTIPNGTIGSGQTYQWQSSPTNSGFTNIGGATDNSLTTSQSVSTYYRVNVTCGGTTVASTPTQVTSPAPASTFPYAQSFSSVTAPALPCGWVANNANADANTWVSYATSPITAPNTASISRPANITSNDWLFSEGFALQGGTTYRVSFDYKVSTAASEHMDVRFGTAQTPGAMNSTAIISTTGLNSLTPATLSGYFTPATTGTYYLGWHAKTPATTTSVRTYIDDIDLREAPTNDAEVLEIYTLGRLPIPFATPHVASASIHNAGIATLVNKQVTLTVTGPGSFSFTDTKTIASLAANATTTVAFAGYSPTVAGTYTVTVTLPSDEDNTNNTKTMTQDVNANAYSYKYPGISNVSGVGVGFNGATGILAAKFSTSSTQEINQVKVDFLGSGQPYEIVIMSANGAGGTPGTILYTSPTLTTAVGTALIPILPPVQVTGNFYIGVRQVGTTNYLFAFQEEVPLRANTFYSGNSAGTSWTPFNSRYRFAVEVELELPPTAPPNCTVYGAPTAGATGQGIAGTLNFTSGGGGPTGFKVYLSTNQADVTSEAAAALVSDQVTLNYNYSGLTYGTVYYWKVVPYNSIGGATTCTVRQFTTRTVDLMANALIAPEGGQLCYTATQQVQVQIRNNAPTGNTMNFAQDPATITVQINTPSGLQTLTHTVNTGTLSSASNLTVTIPTTLNMSAPGNYTFNFTVSVAGDINSANNSLATPVVINTAAKTLPTALVQFNGFTGSNLTALYPDWQEGDGATTPVLGTSGWTTGNTSQENAFTEVAKINLAAATDREWIIGPRIKAAANTTVFWRAGLTGNAVTAASATGMTGSDDAVMVMVSADCGATWTPVYTHNAANQPSNGSLSSYSVNIGSYANQEVIVAFFATEGTVDDTQTYDYLLDAIEIRNVLPLDLAATALKTPGVQDCYAASEPVNVIIRNFGSQALDFTVNNTTVTATVKTSTGIQPLSVTLTDNSLNGGQPLAAGDSLQVLVGNANMALSAQYLFNASTSIITGGTDGNAANNAITPVVRTVYTPKGIASANTLTVCQSGTVTLSLSNMAGVGAIQWEMTTNPASIPYSSIPGGTTSPFTLATPISQTTYFRARLSCGTRNSISNVVRVEVSNPVVSSTNSPVNACGTGPVTLTATGSGTIKWYAASTGGTALHTGNSFTVNPASSTTYYAEAGTAGGVENVGRTTVGTSDFITQDVRWGLLFTVTELTTIQTVHVYPTGTGTITLQITDPTTNAVLQSAAPANISGTGTTKVPVPVNLTLAPGSYRMSMVSTGITNLKRESTGNAFPYTSPSGAVSITAGSSTSGSSVSYYWFYDWQISTGCQSPRVPVQVNFIPLTSLPYGPVTFNGYTGTNLTAVAPGMSEGQGQLRASGTVSDWTVSTAAQQAWFGDETARVNLSGNTRREWIVGPRFVPAADTRLNFEVAVTGPGTSDPAGMGSDDRVAAMVSTDCGNTFTALREFTVTDNLSNILSFNSVSLGAYAGQPVIIAFMATEGFTDNITNYDFHLDNVELLNIVLPPMSGTYSINRADATGNGSTGANARNFRTFTDAMNALNERTVSGNILFNVVANSGPYTERVYISDVVYTPSVANTATITINGNGNVVEAFIPRSTTAGLGVVTIDGTDRVTISGLAIQHSAGSSFGWGIHLINDAQNIVLQNNQITVNGTSTNKRDYMGIVATASYGQYNFPGNNVTNLSILNNQITGGYEGIRINGNPSSYSAGIIITGNTVTNAYKTGLYLQYLNAPVVGSATGTVAVPGNNVVTMRTGNPISQGIHLSLISGAVRVQRNKVSNAGLHGLYLLRINNNASGTAVIANNMIGGGFQNSVEAYGILLNDVDNAQVVFNSVNVDNANTGSALEVLKPYSNNLDIRNNSFAYTGGGAGYAMRIGTDSVLTALDYNNYFTNGSNFVLYARLGRPTLDSLQNSFGPDSLVHDLNSISADPQYASATNLHAQSGSPLGNAGVAIAGITAEYDEASTRSGTRDIGADEFLAGSARLMAASAAAGTLELAAYPNPVPAGATLSVRISSEASAQVRLQLTDLLGRVVLSKVSAVEAGTSTQALEVSTLSKGLYILTVEQGAEKQQIKIVKE